MDDQWWIDHGIPVFAGPVDDWPADRAFWLQRVYQVQDEVRAAEQHKAKRDAEHQKLMQERGHR